MTPNRIISQITVVALIAQFPHAGEYTHKIMLGSGCVLDRSGLNACQRLGLQVTWPTGGHVEH